MFRAALPLPGCTALIVRTYSHLSSSYIPSSYSSGRQVPAWDILRKLSLGSGSKRSRQLRKPRGPGTLSSIEVLDPLSFTPPRHAKVVLRSQLQFLSSFALSRLPRETTERGFVPDWDSSVN